MNDLIIFGGYDVRVLCKDGTNWDGQSEAWFLPTEVAAAIGYSEPRIAASKIINRNPAKFAGFSSVTNMVTEAGTRETTIINENGLYMFLMASDMPKAIEFQRKVSEFLKQMRNGNCKPPSPAEALLQAVQLLAEQDRKLNHQQEQITVINHRINNLDSIDTTGDRRHLLVKLGRRLAQDKGISHPAAWHLFDDAFNTAYRTNLTARRNNYAKRARIKDIGRPEYLEAVGQIEDGIRVMDKLLNGSGRCYGGGC